MRGRELEAYRQALGDKGFGDWLRRTVRDVGRFLRSPVVGLVGATICFALGGGGACAAPAARAIGQLLSRGSADRGADPAQHGHPVYTHGPWKLSRWDASDATDGPTWIAWPATMTPEQAYAADRLLWWTPGLTAWMSAHDVADYAAMNATGGDKAWR